MTNAQLNLAGGLYAGAISCVTTSTLTISGNTATFALGIGSSQTLSLSATSGLARTITITGNNPALAWAGTLTISSTSAALTTVVFAAPTTITGAINFAAGANGNSILSLNGYSFPNLAIFTGSTGTLSLTGNGATIGSISASAGTVSLPLSTAMSVTGNVFSSAGNVLPVSRPLLHAACCMACCVVDWCCDVFPVRMCLWAVGCAQRALLCR
jgi:hypothetical protein